MKTKLVPLALLIPAVVLAQPAPPPLSQSGMPTASTMPAVPPVNPANAANALNTAKKQAKELKSMLPSNGDVGGSIGTGWAASTNSGGSS